MVKYPKVRVLWKDNSAYREDEWVEIDEVIENSGPVVTDTTGFLLPSLSSEYVIVALSINNNDYVGGNICILKRNIIKMSYY